MSLSLLGSKVMYVVDVDDNDNGSLDVSNYFLKCAMTYETEPGRNDKKKSETGLDPNKPQAVKGGHAGAHHWGDGTLIVEGCVEGGNETMIGFRIVRVKTVRVRVRKVGLGLLGLGNRVRTLLQVRVYSMVGR